MLKGKLTQKKPTPRKRVPSSKKTPMRGVTQLSSLKANKGKMIVAVIISAIIAFAMFCGMTLFQIGNSMTDSAHAQDLLAGGVAEADSNVSPTKFYGNVDTVKNVPDDFYVLLLGVDADDNRRTGAEAEQFRKEQGDSFRADSITLAHIDTVNKRVSMCSFDRDLKSIIKGHESQGYKKLNSAYELGGAETMRAEVEELTGLQVPYVAVVDMGGLDALVDAIGGIDVEIEEAFYDEVLGTGFDEAGVQHLDGEKVMVYARSRTPFAEGTGARARHQRMILQAIGEKVAASDALTLTSAVEAASQNIGTNMTLDQILEVASKLKGMDWEKDFHSLSMPTEGCLDGDLWFAFLARNGWQRTLVAFINNDGIKPTDAELAEMDPIELDTDVVFVDEVNYFPNRTDTYTEADRQAEMSASS